MKIRQWVIFGSLVTAFLATLPIAVLAQVRDTSCVTPKRSAVQEEISVGIARASLDTQGRFTWRDNGGATALEMHEALQVAEDKLAARMHRLSDVAFLLTKVAGPDDSPAIAIKGGAGGLTCLVRAGDTILLHSGASVHWTTVYSVDSKNGTYSIADSWPDRFPFLATNSGGQWHATLQAEGSKRLISMPTGDLEKLLMAVVTVDDAHFATRLVKAPCACVVDSSAKGMLDTLLSREDTAAASVAYHLSVAGALGQDNVVNAYYGSAIYLAGARGLPISGTAKGKLANLTRTRGDEAFTAVSPYVLFLMLEKLSAQQLSDKNNALAHAIYAAASHAYATPNLSPLDDGRWRLQRARWLDAQGNTTESIDDVKIAVDRLSKAYQASLANMVSQDDPLDWRAGVAEKNLYRLFQTLVMGKAYAVELYSKKADFVSAKRYFDDLQGMPEPYPPAILIEAAEDGCRARNLPARVSALHTLDPSRHDIRRAIADLACFEQ